MSNLKYDDWCTFSNPNMSFWGAPPPLIIEPIENFQVWQMPGNLRTITNLWVDKYGKLTLDALSVNV